MHVLSVNVSPGRRVPYEGGEITTGIFKEPVAGSVAVGPLGLAGDRQCDPTVHGGEFKAVYAYSWEHYEWWRQELRRRDLTPGAFGENLTVAGLDDDDTALGDVFEIGTTRLVATEPRLPCFKLGLRFGDPRMIDRFLESGRFGIYFRVLRPGALQAGDLVRRVTRVERRLPVPALERLRNDPAARPEEIRAALEMEALSPRWRRALESRLGTNRS